MVWQDMPSLTFTRHPVGTPGSGAAAKAQFETGIARDDRSAPQLTSIIGWVPFNEGWGEYDTGQNRRRR